MRLVDSRPFDQCDDLDAHAIDKPRHAELAKPMLAVDQSDDPAAVALRPAAV